MKSKIKKPSFWFWFWISQITIPKESPKKGLIRGEVWNNLILIKSQNPSQALQKAKKAGAGLNGDARGTLRLDGKLAKSCFLGITDFGLVDGDIEDGVEILFESKRVSLKKSKEKILIRAKIKSRIKLLESIVDRKIRLGSYL
jgi:hypothetical protein